MHLVGIGGIGMSGIARVLHGRGVVVSGCDRSDGPALDALRALGITCSVPHDPRHLGGVSELVVSSAVDADEPELVRARELGLQIRHRSEALAAILAGHDRRVVVTGAHGKTTTSAMLAVALTALGRSPSFVVGGEVRQLGTNAAGGDGDICVAEGDESDRSVARLPADIAVGAQRRPRPPRPLRLGGRRGRAARVVDGAAAGRRAAGLRRRRRAARAPQGAVRRGRRSGIARTRRDGGGCTRGSRASRGGTRRRRAHVWRGCAERRAHDDVHAFDLRVGRPGVRGVEQLLQRWRRRVVDDQQRRHAASVAGT